MKLKHSIWGMAAAVGLVLSCGENSFKDFEKVNIPEEATKEMEAQRPEKAIELVLNSLGNAYRRLFESIDEASDLDTIERQLNIEMTRLITTEGRTDVPNLVSILSSAQAQLFGADPFSIALILATSSSSSSSLTLADNGPNTLTKLFPILPKSTTANVRGLEIAITLLNSMTTTYRSKADEFKKAIFLTADVALITKGLDINGDGIISVEEALNLSEDAASALLSIIASAVSSGQSSGQTGEKSAAITQSIAAIQDKINAQPGATMNDKLRNFLASKGS